MILMQKGCFDYVFESKDKKSKSAVVVKDVKRGYISKETGEVIFEPQFKFAWVDNGVNDLAACVNEEDKLGFVNIKTKEIAIPFQFDYDAIELNSYIYGYQWDFANCNFDFVFSNGWCLVPGVGGKLGLINESGEIVLPIKYYNIINWKDKNSPNIPLVTIEYSLLTKKILQCYADYNSQPSKEISHYIKKQWLPYANRQINKIKGARLCA